MPSNFTELMMANKDRNCILELQDVMVYEICQEILTSGAIQRRVPTWFVWFWACVPPTNVIPKSDIFNCDAKPRLTTGKQTADLPHREASSSRNRTWPRFSRFSTASKTGQTTRQ